MPASPQAVSPQVPASEPASPCRHGRSLHSGDPAPGPGQGPSLQQAWDRREPPSSEPAPRGQSAPQWPTRSEDSLRASELRVSEDPEERPGGGGRRFRASGMTAAGRGNGGGVARRGQC